MLIHAREIIKAAIVAGDDNGVWAVIDVDFVNSFPTFFHEAIDRAVESRIPELQPWSHWCQAHCGNILLPCGAKHRALRGAGRGGPLASLLCGCATADVIANALADMRKRKGPSLLLSCFGVWYCDDGQYFCRPEDVDLFLDCLGKAAAQSGLSRGSGPDVKS